MDQLKYVLTDVGEGKLSFTIEEQPEFLTTYIKSRQNQVFRASNGWGVAISVHPEFNVKDKVIYLRGSDSDEDDRVNSHWNLNSKEVKNAIKDGNRAIEEAFSAAKSWKPTKTFGIEKYVIVNVANYDPFMSFRRNPRIVIID